MAQRAVRAALLLAIAPVCGLVPPALATCTDGDGDGYFVEATCGGPADCDDRDPATFPGAVESCDRRDEDCDGLADFDRARPDLEICAPDFYVDCEYGDDAAGGTTAATAWRTLTHAASELGASGGGLVKLLPGTCDEERAVVHLPEDTDLLGSGSEITLVEADIELHSVYATVSRLAARSVIARDNHGRVTLWDVRTPLAGALGDYPALTVLDSMVESASVVGADSSVDQLIAVDSRLGSVTVYGEDFSPKSVVVEGNTVERLILTPHFGGRIVRNTFVHGGSAAIDVANGDLRGGPLLVADNVFVGGGPVIAEDRYAWETRLTFQNNVVAETAATALRFEHSGMRWEIDGNIFHGTGSAPVVDVSGCPAGGSTPCVPDPLASVAYNDFHGMAGDLVCTFEACLGAGDLDDASFAAGNLSVDPDFVDAANGNYRLRAGSPLIDHIPADFPIVEPFDLDGTRRPRDGDGDGTAEYDVGAFELVPPVAMIHDLIERVRSLGLHQGIENGLLAKLDSAAATLADLDTGNDVAAVNALAAFTRQVGAQSGKKISWTDADALGAAADGIIELLTGRTRMRRGLVERLQAPGRRRGQSPGEPE
jgi:hypothetical protein